MYIKGLEIFIITYNRVALLEKTLNYFIDSPLANHKITILNNHSTDNTLAVCDDYKSYLCGLNIVTHRVNIGAGANFLRAFELSESTYTWVVCDDDFIDLSMISDVLQVVDECKVDLIHVGAHKRKNWTIGGDYKTPKELLSLTYPYFRFSSFIPCNIFKTEVFVKEYLVQGYRNISNFYPHMPFVFGIYLKNSNVYIAKRQIAFALDGQSYSVRDWYPWWMRTCELLKEPMYVRASYLDQWKDDEVTTDDAGLKSLLLAKDIAEDAEYVKNFISKYFTSSDKRKLRLFSYQESIKKVKSGELTLRDIIYRQRMILKKKYNNS